MDCKTARLLLDFARPQTRELEAEEATALERHLDHCPDCHSQASRERQLDEAFGRAMRQVEVPAGLRDQLVARLEAERGDWYRQRFARTARLCAAAAAVLVLAWFGLYWVLNRLTPSVDPHQVIAAVQNDAEEDPRTRTEQALKRLGIETPLPYLNYHLLACPPFLTELPGYPGRKVPCLLFIQNGRTARVYLIRERAIPKDTAVAIDGGSYKAEFLPSASEREPYRFLVIHDGANIEWLYPPKPQEA